MEFTELADYAIPSGSLVEWLPCATGRWTPDPRPASYIHEAHLQRSSAGAGGQSWLGTAFEIPGPLDLEAFRITLQQWIDRHEVLRSHTSLDTESGEIIRHTVPVNGIDIGVVDHGYNSPSQVNFEHLHRLFDEFASPHSWPSYVFATLTPRTDDGPFTVFFAADHSIIDGFSIVLIAHEIASLYRENLTGQPANLFPVGSYVDFGAQERQQMADQDAEDAALDVWREAMEDGGLPSFHCLSATGVRSPRTGCRRGFSTPISRRRSAPSAPRAGSATSRDCSAVLPPSDMTSPGSIISGS